MAKKKTSLSKKIGSGIATSILAPDSLSGLEAELRQQGFADAVARRAGAFGQQQALANQRANLAAQQAGLAQNQFALSNFQRAGTAADVANLGQLGAFRQGLDQSLLI